MSIVSLDVINKLRIKLSGHEK